ncbi:hypothetical protein ACNKHL_00055 [Shigella flexneri]
MIFPAGHGVVLAVLLLLAITRGLHGVARPCRVLSVDGDNLGTDRLVICVMNMGNFPTSLVYL